MSQKAAEADALNDRLTEEKKRSRDLQWAMEKERCETGRNEESKREKLEVCFSPMFPKGQRWTFHTQNTQRVQRNDQLTHIHIHP